MNSSIVFNAANLAVEVPQNESVAELRVEVSFSGLVGTTTAPHIHCCTASPLSGNAGVATLTPTFTGFPLGVTSGTYHLTLSPSWNPAFVTAHGDWRRTLPWPRAERT